MFSFKELIEQSKKTGCTCWTGYKRVPGTKPCESGSCMKEERGLWDNIHAKRERIKKGSGEKMRMPGSEGAPTAAALKASQNEETDLDKFKKYTRPVVKTTPKIERTTNPSGRTTDHVEWKVTTPTGEIHRHKSKKEAQAHFDSFGKPNMEELEAQFDLIESVVEELAMLHNLDSDYVWEKFEQFSDQELLEYAVDAKGHKSSTGGLTQKGRDAYNSKGAHLQAPVTTPPSKLAPGSKAANRRKSFCARMGGMEGPMKKPNGEPSRKALALRKWNC